MTKNILRNVVLKDLKMKFFDHQKSHTIAIVEEEISKGEYSILFNKANFKPGDIVIDIGGNVGLISIYLAKKYPFLKIYAFEPVFENWKNFKRNMSLNNVSNSQIKLHNCAITCDGRLVKVNTYFGNTGGSTMLDVSNYNMQQTVKSVTLD